jgi:hypothetical protein
MTRFRAELRKVGAAAGFLAGLGPFLRARVTTAEARAWLDDQLTQRAAAFLMLLRRAVFANPHSPYLKLFEWARLSADDVDEMIRTSGVEGTLGRLHDAGIWVTLEEFKGRTPLRRPGLELPLSAEEFDNPLSARHYAARTGGSSGPAQRIAVGLDLLAHETAYHAVFYATMAAEGRAAALWLPAPPGAVGIKNALIRARLGEPVERWFSQTRGNSGPILHRAFARAAAAAASLQGIAIPKPEYAPAAHAGVVAAWLADRREHQRPAILLTTPSAAVRTCAAAVERSLDIAGTLFVLVGEPFTVAKAAVIAAAGAEAASHYAMVEAGMIGLACRSANEPDDVHLVSDKIATITRARTVGEDGSTVQAMLHTTLRPATPKVMLNVESGDYAVLEERDCNCGILPAAYRRHVHTIRSYEKLTGEGMHFLGSDLLQLLESELPARFGGRPTDYQMVEREQDGITKVSLVIRPSLGVLDTADVVDTVLEFLRQRGAGGRLMSEVWANGGTLEVVRADPHVTRAGKIQPLQKLEA